MNQSTVSIPTVSAKTLHLLAMAFMFLDHLWATVIPGQEWLTCIGRLAFPIFSFLIVEGYFHTHSFKKYMLRLLGFAIISEIPFDLMYGGTIFFPFHQNVLWTFLIALAAIYFVEALKRYPKWIALPASMCIMAFAALLAQIAMTDYYAAGVLMVFTFYLFRGKSRRCFVGQLVCLYFINSYLLGSLYYHFSFLGMEVKFVQQALALFALIPIWLYNGSRGNHSKAFQYFCYAFYPAHILILSLIGLIL